jgi:hypothetical protein
LWEPAQPACAAPPDFRFDIRPVLAKNCFACHGPDDAHREAELRLDFRDDAVDYGAIVPGDPEASELVRRIASDDPDERMPPPDSGRKLAEAEIEHIKRWIADGAPYSRHWSYEPPQRPPVPEASAHSWPRNAIDHFVLEHLDAAGLAPEPEADRPRLIRRLSLDLTGLPPTLSEVDDFVLDNGNDAYEQLVDRLLASPAYGEHFARAWLDLARYADTNGFEKDSPRTMWPYRDWVIDALNRDMPFDQFTIEQLAGDLLDDPTRDQIIATGLHRNTMQNDEDGTDDEEFRVAAVIDRVNTTMQAWMGTTMGCCQCHSHKYDPLTHREYYELFAFFNQTADADRDDQEPTLAASSADERERRARRRRVRELERELRTAEGKLDSAQRKRLADELANARRRLDQAQPAKMPIMRELPPDKRRPTRVFIRGSFLNPGEAVEPDTPAVFPPFPPKAPLNRLGLAQWLVDRQNPLTARVAANRLWEQLFGAGLVLTPEDFGSQGALPTHPELLDWLAVELMDHGWSLKHLTKTIVMSAAYRQASCIKPEKLARDPENRLLSRGPRYRLSAEQIRDQALLVSGRLSRKMGGPSVMPPQPDGVWQVVYSDEKWKTSRGEDRYRRGLYTYWRRTSPYPSAMALDATSRETCTIRRVRTNTPVAAFALLNDPVYVEAAQALARCIVDHGGDDPRTAAAYGFRRVLARPPTSAEIDRLVELFESQRSHFGQDQPAAEKMATDPLGPAPASHPLADLAAWTVVSNVLLNLDETLQN